jgi:hypothetical protein
MATILDNTLATETSNSYIDTNYALDYFGNHFNALKASTWLALTDDQQTQALVQACWDLEQFRYVIATDYTTPRISDLRWDSRTGRFTAYQSPTLEPAKFNYYQALQFPRNRFPDVKLDGSLQIPERIKFAQCEQAIWLVTIDETALANRLLGINVDKVSIGRGQITTTQEYEFQGSMLAPLALEYIRPFLIWGQRTKRS